jgi:DNA-directed RNA polymerase specialized sigma24 family protein
MMTSPRDGALEARFEELYRTEHERLWRAVYAFVRNSDVASDAVAEAFAQCLRRGDHVRDQRAWVWKAAFAIARGSLAERARWVGLSADRRHAPDPGAGPLDRVMSALAQLSDKQRAVILLRHYAGYRSREVAELLGMAPATVRVHLARGRRNLERALEEPDDEDRT